MNNHTFSPQSPQHPDGDALVTSLQKLARYLFIAVIGIMPVFFVPIAMAPLSHTKTVFVLTGTLIALVFFALSTLRLGKLRFRLPLPLLALWGFVIAAALSGLLSGSQYNTFVAYDLGTQTVVFLGLLAVLITTAQLLLVEKTEIMYLYLVLFSTGIILSVFHSIRLFFGAEFISFGIDLPSTFSVLGTWNDLAIFYGLLLLLSLVTLEELPLPRIGRFIFATVAVVALAFLIIVQFTAVWVLVGLATLVIVMYSLMRKRLNVEYREISKASIIIAGITATLSCIFIIGGPNITDRISEITNTNYIEVRPSVTATAEIARNVYAENVLLGIGPNRFQDAWRLYKDLTINETIFWNTNFISGSGYVPTLFITTGLLGSVLLILFLGLFFWRQYRALFYPKQQDHFWYFIANSSTIAAAYLWVTLFIYTPSASIILLTAIFSAIALVSSSVLLQSNVYWFDTIKDNRKMVVLSLAVIIILIGSVSSVYLAQNHYGTHVSFNRVISDPTQSVDERHERLLDITLRSSTDLYPRVLAQSALQEVNRMLLLPDPTSADADRFVQQFQLALQAANESVQRDRQKAINWATLAAVYSAYASPESPDAGNLARQNLERAKALDPQHPEFYVLAGEVAIRENNLEEARGHFERAIVLKSNYVAALSALAEIEIATNNVAAARSNIQRIIQLQPNNPGRYYQLAILYLADELTDQAIENLTVAIRIDPQFANARYILALQYVERNQFQAAIEQLEVVAELNPDNTEVAEILTQLRAGETPSVPNQPIPPTGETITVPSEDSNVFGSDGSETDLLQSTNPSPRSDDTIQEDSAETVIEAFPDEPGQGDVEQDNTEVSD